MNDQDELAPAGEPVLGPPSWEITAEIRGMSFHPPAKALIEALHVGAELELEREPGNKYDINAVKVWVKPSTLRDRAEVEVLIAGFGLTLEEFDATPMYMLGYIGKEWAAELSPRMAQGGQAKATLCFSGAGKPQAKVELFD